MKMRTYKPRRASKKWIDGAPDYVLACYDYGGKTIDRYTVLFGGDFWGEHMGRTVQYLGMSSNPTSPFGFSQWGECQCFDRSAFGRKVRWNDLPENIQQHVIFRATE